MKSRPQIETENWQPAQWCVILLQKYCTWRKSSRIAKRVPSHFDSTLISLVTSNTDNKLNTSKGQIVRCYPNQRKCRVLMLQTNILRFDLMWHFVRFLACISLFAILDIRLVVVVVLRIQHSCNQTRHLVPSTVRLHQAGSLSQQHF